MKDKWRIKYQKIDSIIQGERVSVLTGFNANIDILHNLSDLDLDLEDSRPELQNTVETQGDVNSCLKYCLENEFNKEVNRGTFEERFSGGEERLGGQGGIMANYLSKTDNYAILYTPLLSEELADKIEDEVVYPALEGKLLLKRASECVNTERTKRNTIIEFDQGKTGRLIISDKIKGFGPYFRQGIEDNFEKLDEQLDRIILSGFQNISGNYESKIEKSKIQLRKLDTPKHLEYVSMNNKKAEKIIDELLPVFDSIGMDEEEAKEVANILEQEVGERLSLGEAFQLGKTLIKEKNISRCHIHTYRYHITVTSSDYDVELSKIQRAMLYGEASAIKMAEQGEIPSKNDMESFDLNGVHVHRLDELEDFGHHLDIDDFPETGLAEVNGLDVVAIPTLIHEDPKRLVGMGDVISSGTFVGELR